jgi:hypothetical protein
MWTPLVTALTMANGAMNVLRRSQMANSRVPKKFRNANEN